MKTLFLVCTFTWGLVFAAATNAAVNEAKGKELAAKYNCQACHAVDKKVVGPGYKEIAKRYARDKSAAAKLEQKVKSDGSGVWVSVPMPPNNVPDADA